MNAIHSSEPGLELMPSQRKLTVCWNDTDSSAFHYVWLRHHARCAEAAADDTTIKIDLLPEDPSSLVIDAADIDGDHVVIRWQDDALTTRHPLADLRARAYDSASRQRRKHQPSLWNRDSAAELPRFDYSALNTDSNRLALLLALRDYGFVRLHSVPAIADTIVDVAEMFGPVHVNNYGRVFDVKTDDQRMLGSNTGAYLPPHTDESYRHDAPGISFFHCLQASTAGGESTLVDGFEAARILRQRDPEAYAVLCQTPLFFQRRVLPVDDMRSHTRVLVEDIDGDLVGLRWTDRTLPPQDLPEDRVEPVYRALRRFRDIVNDPALQFCYRLEPGDLHLFDNHRVLHGRLGFSADSGARHLQQCSVNRDEFHNNLRRLAAALDDPAADLVMCGGAVG